MLDHIHNHIVSELEQNTRTDRIFVITAIAFNLIALGINIGFADATDYDYYGNPTRDPTNDILLGIFILVTLIINLIAFLGLQTGKRSRHKLLSGLLAMYQDNQVDKYYDASLLEGYNNRYSLFTAVILVLGATSIVIPLIIRLT